MSYFSLLYNPLQEDISYPPQPSHIGIGGVSKSNVNAGPSINPNKGSGGNS